MTAKSPSGKKKPGYEKNLLRDQFRMFVAQHFGCPGTCKHDSCGKDRECRGFLNGYARCDSPRWDPDFERLVERFVVFFETAFEEEPPGWLYEVQEARLEFERLIDRHIDHRKQQQRDRRRNGQSPIPPTSEPERP